MLQGIALIIASYTITRLIELIATEGKSFGLKIIAVLAILLTLISLAGVLMAGLAVPNLPR